MKSVFMELQLNKLNFYNPDSWKSILLPYKTDLLRIALQYGIDPQKNRLFFIFKNAIKQNSFDESWMIDNLQRLRLLRFLYLNESGVVIKAKYGEKSSFELNRTGVARLQRHLQREIIGDFTISNDILPSDSINENTFDDYFVDPDTDLERFNYTFQFKLQELIEKKNKDETIKFLKSDVKFVETFHANKEGISDLIKNEALAIEYQKKKKNYGKPFLNKLILDIVQKAKELEIFDKSLKTISTPEACFLYDSIILLGFINGDEFANNQEKYQYIKRSLK